MLALACLLGLLFAAVPVSSQDFKIPQFFALIESTTRQAQITQRRFNFTRDFSCSKPRKSCIDAINLTADEYQKLRQRITEMNDYVRPLEHQEIRDQLSPSQQKSIRLGFAHLFHWTAMDVSGIDHLFSLNFGRGSARNHLIEAQDNLYFSQNGFVVVMQIFRDRAQRIYSEFPVPDIVFKQGGDLPESLEVQ